MKGEVAQVVAFTCWANAKLAGPDVDDFLGKDSTCQFCQCVRFVRPQHGSAPAGKEELVAPSPDAWFDHLERRPRRGYHQDLAPSGVLDSTASGVLDACQTAWAFGDMGSWNDMGFEGLTQARYQAVSDQLFDALNAAILAATGRT